MNAAEEIHVGPGLPAEPANGRRVRASAIPSSAAVSSRMSRHPRRDTGPELAVRRILHRAGMRYRVQVPVPGMSRRTIDLVFPRWKVAVFVDGCFWHGCATHRSVPAANGTFWQQKIEGNMARDIQTSDHLRSLGWRVVRIWEHEAPGDAADQVIATVTGVRSEFERTPARRRSSVVEGS